MIILLFYIIIHHIIFIYLRQNITLRITMIIFAKYLLRLEFSQYRNNEMFCYYVVVNVYYL